MTTGSAIFMALAMVLVVLTLIASGSSAFTSTESDKRWFIKVSLIFAVMAEACIIGMAVTS